MSIRNLTAAGSVLPEQGVTAVLIQAAADNPIVALILVCALIASTVWAIAWASVKRKQLEVMKSPEAARAMVELKKLELASKKAMKKLKANG